MMLYFSLQLVLLLIGISIVSRVWRASTLDGVLCLIIPFYVLLAMVKHWNDPQHDIRWHVVLLFACAIGVVWAQSHLAREVLSEAAVQQALLRDTEAAQEAMSAAEADADDGDSADDTASESARLARYQEKVEFGRAPHAPHLDAPPPAAAAAATHEPDTPARKVAPAAPLTPRQALAAATFQRGVFARPSLGFSIELPQHFHALAGGDVRRIEASRNQAADAREVAWVAHESVALDGAAAWYVRVRWLSDGWVQAGALDAPRLLQGAQRGAALRRLAGSGGDLIGYAVAPSFSGGVADWVEERLPAGANASVLDCHALRLGRNGVVEFSVVAAPAGAQALCDASVRLLARNTRFEAGADYAPGAGAAPRAPYTLAQLLGAAH